MTIYRQRGAKKQNSKIYSILQHKINFKGDLQEDMHSIIDN